MIAPLQGLDFLATVQATVTSFARWLGRDHAAACILWHAGQGELAHSDRVPPQVSHALVGPGGYRIAEMARRSGRPIEVSAAALPDEASELRIALRASEFVSLAILPLFCEGGFLGVVVAPMGQGDESCRGRSDPQWRLAGRALEHVRLSAAVGALRVVAAMDRRRRIELPDGTLVVDEASRVVFTDGMFEGLHGLAQGRNMAPRLHDLPDAEVLLALPVSPADNFQWEEQILSLGTSEGVPVSLAKVPLPSRLGSEASSHAVFMRDLRADGGHVRERPERMPVLAIRIAHMADELGRAIQLSEVQGDDRGREAARALAYQLTIQEAEQLLDDVLEHWSPEEGLLKLDLNLVVEEVLARCHRELGLERVKLFTFPRPDLPSVPGDRRELLTAVHTLVEAAREALRPGGGTLTVRTWTENEWVYAAISDDGRGRQDNAALIWSPLYDDPDGAREAGLHAVRTALEEMGGRLLLEHRPKVWSRATIMLPQERRAAARPGRGQESDRVWATSDVRLSVLLIDDNAAVRSVVRRCLERRGHEVVEGTDGEHGLRLVGEHAFDRVVVDIQMPVKTGIEFYQELARVAPAMQQRTVFMTGGLLEQETERLITLSGRPTLRKPFDIETIAKSIEA